MHNIILDCFDFFKIIPLFKDSGTADILMESFRVSRGLMEPFRDSRGLRFIFMATITVTDHQIHLANAFAVYHQL